MLYNFAFGRDGYGPQAGLTWGKGGLYGTTTGGGNAGAGRCPNSTQANTCGVVFQLVPASAGVN